MKGFYEFFATQFGLLNAVIATFPPIFLKYMEFPIPFPGGAGHAGAAENFRTLAAFLISVTFVLIIALFYSFSEKLKSLLATPDGQARFTKWIVSWGPPLLLATTLVAGYLYLLLLQTGPEAIQGCGNEMCTTQFYALTLMIILFVAPVLALTIITTRAYLKTLS